MLDLSEEVDEENISTCKSYLERMAKMKVGVSAVQEDFHVMEQSGSACSFWVSSCTKDVGKRKRSIHLKVVHQRCISVLACTTNDGGFVENSCVEISVVHRLRSLGTCWLRIVRARVVVSPLFE